MSLLTLVLDAELERFSGQQSVEESFGCTSLEMQPSRYRNREPREDRESETPMPFDNAVVKLNQIEITHCGNFM
jgi:hypothetical protein